MLKLILKLVFMLAAIIPLALIYYGSKQQKLEHLVALLGACGYVLMSAVDIWDYCKSKKETTASELADRRKRLRNISDLFRVDSQAFLIEWGIIKTKSELTNERIYELSQDAHVISLLNEHEYVGTKHQLEDFAELYKSDK